MAKKKDGKGAKDPQHHGHHATANDVACWDCAEHATERLDEMFVDLIQRQRIERGQRPARRTVFLKQHGVAYGRFRPLEDLPPDLAIGTFAYGELPCWVRFSSDTQPTSPDLHSTLGVGIKLFGVPGPKLFGEGDTADFILQNHDVFFVDDAQEFCEFTTAGVIDEDYPAYLRRHPKTARILDEMQKPEASCLTASYWAILPFAFGEKDGERRYVKYRLTPVGQPEGEPFDDPDYLAIDLASRLRRGDATFRFESSRAPTRRRIRSTERRCAGRGRGSTWRTWCSRARTSRPAGTPSTARTSPSTSGARRRCRSRRGASPRRAGWSTRGAPTSGGWRTASPSPSRRSRRPRATRRGGASSRRARSRSRTAASSARLIVLGGHGVSASYDGGKAVTFANNEGWHDDVSDGPVKAEVVYEGVKLEVDPAWVVCAPPNYGPRQKSVRTMWDLMRSVAVDAGMLAHPERPSFENDIRPIFERMSHMIDHFGEMGVVEVREGLPDDPEFPAVMQVSDQREEPVWKGVNVATPGEPREVTDLSNIQKVNRFPHGLVRSR